MATSRSRGLRRAHVKDIIGAKAATPEAANHLLKVLRIILAYAVDQGMIANNPAVGVKKYQQPRRRPSLVERSRDCAI